MNKLLYLLLPLLFATSFISADYSTYANSIEYIVNEEASIHLADYKGLQLTVITNVDFKDFGDQVIMSYEGDCLYKNEGRNEYIFYPDFFILVNYYHEFEVVSVGKYGFDGIEVLTNVNTQYIQFYE